MKLSKRRAREIILEEVKLISEEMGGGWGDFYEDETITQSVAASAEEGWRNLSFAAKRDIVLSLPVIDEIGDFASFIYYAATGDKEEAGYALGMIAMPGVLERIGVAGKAFFKALKGGDEAALRSADEILAAKHGLKGKNKRDFAKSMRHVTDDATENIRRSLVDARDFAEMGEPELLFDLADELTLAVDELRAGLKAAKAGTDVPPRIVARMEDNLDRANQTLRYIDTGAMSDLALGATEDQLRRIDDVIAARRAPGMRGQGVLGGSIRLSERFKNALAAARNNKLKTAVLSLLVYYKGDDVLGFLMDTVTEYTIAPILDSKEAARRHKELEEEAEKAVARGELTQEQAAELINLGQVDTGDIGRLDDYYED
jgi:hypothetical protein